MHIACDCLFVGGHNRRLNNQIKVCGVLLSLSLFCCHCSLLFESLTTAAAGGRRGRMNEMPSIRPFQL